MSDKQGNNPPNKPGSSEQPPAERRQRQDRRNPNSDRRGEDRTLFEGEPRRRKPDRRKN